MGESDVEKRSDFWMKVAGVAFGLWALAIPIGASMVMSSVREAVDSQRAFAAQFNNYVVTMERRLTMVESEHIQIMRRLESVDAYHDRMNGNGLRQK